MDMVMDKRFLIGVVVGVVLVKIVLPKVAPGLAAKLP
jgi:hypothetical protein